MILLLSLSLPFLARAAGRDWLGLKTVWRILFGVPFGYTAFVLSGYWWVGVIGWIFTWTAFKIGHGTFYAMIGYYDHNRDPSKPNQPRIQTIERIVRPVYALLKGDIYKPLYSWVCMGFKGLLIGISAGLPGLLLTFLWPFSYWLGFRKIQSPALSEWISGACAGAVIFWALRMV